LTQSGHCVGWPPGGASRLVVRSVFLQTWDCPLCMFFCIWKRTVREPTSRAFSARTKEAKCVQRGGKLRWRDRV